MSFCAVIPHTCVLLRNLVLSAFPRTMRLPDPFTPNLKVDLLPEIAQSPRILIDYVTSLTERGIKPRIDAFLTSRQPVDFPSQLSAMLSGTARIIDMLPLISAIVVYVGVQANSIIQQSKSAALQSSPALDLFKQLIAGLDAEGRYVLLNAMANQLRYPNNQTHFFSCILLLLFADAEQEFLQEQITRVLLERLIVHRPHPVSVIIFCCFCLTVCLQWGLLVTFIELIKNPRYAFWRKPFTRCAPEIERVFESVSRSCIGAPGGTSGAPVPVASGGSA